MNNRLKTLRKKLNLNQNDFGNKIGISNFAISKIEKGINNLSEQNVKAICREFEVNEDWLRTGNGEMFNKSVNLSLDKFLKNQNATKLEIEIVKLFFSVDKEIRNDLLKKLKNVFQSEAEAPNEISEVREDKTPDYEKYSKKELYEMYQRESNLREKEEAEKYAALQQQSEETDSDGNLA